MIYKRPQGSVNINETLIDAYENRSVNRSLGCIPRLSQYFWCLASAGQNVLAGSKLVATG